MMLDIQSISFSFGNTPLINELSLSADEGEIVALIGISGSGKTTLFRLIAGLLQPQKGKITIQGQTISQGSFLTTYMHQEDMLLPWRTVLGNLLLFTELGKKKKIDKVHLKKEALILLKQVGLPDIADVYPNKLSGGMRQRIALARSLLQNRPLMLLDEPFASLDVIMREQLYVLMRQMRDQYKKTMVMVTHDFRDAIALADRVLILSRGKISEKYVVTQKIKDNPKEIHNLMQHMRSELEKSSNSYVY